MNFAVIFDVDGVLLELTRDEEELFFDAFAKHLDASTLPRDWNSYRIRNDEDIIREIVDRYRLPPHDAATITNEYLYTLKSALARGLLSKPIEGAELLLRNLAPLTTLGIATANFHHAAKLRLRQVNMWQYVSALAFGADGGGHKSEILARAVAATGLPSSNIIFIGDNVNDVVAAIKNQTQFIGFSTSAARLVQLRDAGAMHLSNAHDHTEKIVRQLLNAAN